MNVSNPELYKLIDQTIESLCKWVLFKMENGTSSEELSALPEVVKAIAELIKG